MSVCVCVCVCLCVCMCVWPLTETKSYPGAWSRCSSSKNLVIRSRSRCARKSRVCALHTTKTLTNQAFYICPVLIALIYSCLYMSSLDYVYRSFSRVFSNFSYVLSGLYLTVAFISCPVLIAFIYSFLKMSGHGCANL